MSLVRHQPERNDIYLLTEEGPHLQKVPSDVPFNVMTPEFVHRLPNIPEIWHHWTPFAFLRLFLPDIIPGYRRILYLDCDIRIEGSVAPLFGLDMKGAAIAAVDDVMTFFKPTIRSEIAPVEKGRRALGFGPDEPYFNSGVLLIDCDRWQRDRMTDAATDCIVRLRTHLLLDQDVLNVIQLDQDVLNVIFRKAWLPLSPRWNFPSQAFETDVEALIRPVVYHHMYPKPWKFGEGSRREKAHFKKSIRKTPYRDFMRAQRPSFHQVKRLVERRVKEMVQYATFFLPSSYERLQARSRSHIQRAAAKHVIENVRSRRFADVDQNISVIDVSALLSLL